MTEVDSDCWLIAEVPATDPDSAFRRAIEDVLPRVVSVLSLAVPLAPYRIQVLGAQGPTGAYTYSTYKAVLYYGEDVLSEDDAQVASARLDACGDNEHLANALHAFGRGIDLLGQYGGTTTTSAAVLAFFQVLESCAMVVRWDPPADYGVRQQEILRTARDALNSRRGERRQEAAIHTASDALKRLDARFTDFRIVHAARAFGLAETWIHRAKELGRFRSQRLGHGSTPPSMKELELWAPSGPSEDSAFSVSAAMLRAATDYAREA